MPPSIFGRSDVSLKKGVAAADGFFGKGKVRNQKKAAGVVSPRTFSIILPNLIHGDKKHL